MITRTVSRSSPSSAAASNLSLIEGLEELGPFSHAIPVPPSFNEAPLYVAHIGWEKEGDYRSYHSQPQSSYFCFSWEVGRVLGEFSLVFVVQGEGDLHTKTSRLRLRAGEAYLLKSGEWHRHRPAPGIGWTILWIKFNGTIPNQWLKSKAFKTGKNLTLITASDFFQTQFLNLLRSTRSLSAHTPDSITWQTVSLLATFLAHSAHETETSAPTTPTDAKVEAAMDYIWTEDCRKFTVEDVSRHVNLNRRTLERRFKAINRVTLLSEIQRCRLARAELLLLQSKMSIKFVVNHCGFANYQHMRKVFQKQFGVSPQEFRTSARANPLA